MDVHPLIEHQPDPDHPGWWSWDVERADDTRFNATIGKLAGPRRRAGAGVCRMFPGGAPFQPRRHGPWRGDPDLHRHGLFAGGRLAGANVIRAVTLDLSTRFLSPRPDRRAARRRGRAAAAARRRLSVGRGRARQVDADGPRLRAIAYAPKRRVHFHEFMLEVHERLRAERAKEEGDPIPPVAEAIAAEAKLLASTRW
jgi:hypothetical protein